MTDNRWIIASNRLPYSIDNTKKLSPSSGGLVTAISGIKSPINLVWVGIAPEGSTHKQWKKLSGQKRYFHPLFVDEPTYESYYNGISNNVLWPLLHYESGYVDFDWKNWPAYEKVNRRFAEEIASIAKPDDLVWIHDFHLFLVPAFLKKLSRRLRVGFFLHIPFPSSEIFRQTPLRKKILSSLLECDLVGFHDYSYLRHFCSSVQLILGLETNLLGVNLGKRKVKFGVFPVSIDTQRFCTLPESTEVQREYRMLEKQHVQKKFILGVDRLDYTKGIELKLLAFREFLIMHPEFRGDVSLLQIAVPSRTDVPEYMRLQDNVATLVGKINGDFGHPGYTPVQCLFQSTSIHELLALYRTADLLLVTSKRDGMNLVSLEYIAAQDPQNPGVVLLSEFTGAISTLSHAVSINPWDVLGTARIIAESLKMPLEKRKNDHRQMLNYLKNYTASDWAASFMKALKKTNRKTGSTHQQVIRITPTSPLPALIKKQLQNKKLVLLLDFDGTLVPIIPDPMGINLDPKTKRILKLILKKNTLHEIIIVSGREARFLMRQFEGLPVSIAAEHGAKFFDHHTGLWNSLVWSDKQSWYPLARKFITDYAVRVPDSLVEEKEFCITWHYRNSPREFAAYLSKKLKEELEMGLSNFPVTVIGGKKIIEARAAEANKGRFVRWLMQRRLQSPDLAIMALGDDETDEEMFNGLPDHAIKIRVGEPESVAPWLIKSQEEVPLFLKKLEDLLE